MKRKKKVHYHKYISRIICSCGKEDKAHKHKYDRLCFHNPIGGNICNKCMNADEPFCVCGEMRNYD